MNKRKIFFYILLALPLASLAMENEEKESSVAVVWCNNNEGREFQDRWMYDFCPERGHTLGIFDGHIGSKTADYLAKNISVHFKQQNDNDQRVNIAKALLAADEAVKDFNDGSTAVVVNVRHDKLLVANVGDSRCLLLDLGLGKPYVQGIKFVTKEHAPEGDELARINQAGGSLDAGYVYANNNAEDGFAMTRVMGDHHADPEKKVFIAVPDCTEFEISDLSPESYLVLATDGLWDGLSNQRASEIMGFCLRKNDSLSKIAKALVTEAIQKHSADDITCMLVKLKALARDKQTYVKEVALERGSIKK